MFRAVPCRAVPGLVCAVPENPCRSVPQVNRAKVQHPCLALGVAAHVTFWW